MLKGIVGNSNKQQGLRTTLRNWVLSHPHRGQVLDLAMAVGVGHRALLAWINDQDHLYHVGCITKMVALEDKKKREKKKKLNRIKAVGVHKYANRLLSDAKKDPEFDPRVFMRT